MAKLSPDAKHGKANVKNTAEEELEGRRATILMENILQ